MTTKVNATPEVASVRVVTISSTYGAGGSVIAPAVAKRLTLPFADRLIPARDTAAPSSGERVSDAERKQEPRRSFFARLATLNAGLNFPLPRDPVVLQADVRERVEASIAELLAAGGGVILGRAAAVVLANHPRAYHVRLDGPVERRVRRGALLEGVDDETARSRLAETDEARIRYVRRLYQRDPADPSLYHLLVDTTVLAHDDAVDLVADAATAFWSKGGDGVGEMSPKPGEARRPGHGTDEMPRGAES
ncbi:MAG TPA: cytidylate kinase-like family protein [Acidimicrobiales bacterium]|nr:cytidylate kinase-like family protein [Acidimicrobiales bacterium]